MHLRSERPVRRASSEGAVRTRDHRGTTAGIAHGSHRLAPALRL